MVFPTPFEDINAVLLGLIARIRIILGSQFIGLYLYGSLALGDFDPQISDIDLIVVTKCEISAGQVSSLRGLHHEFDRSGSAWSGKVEAAYIPLEALRQPAPPTTPYPQVERGRELFLAPLEDGWPFQRFTLRERGVAVYGPGPKTFTDPVSLSEMKQAAIVILSRWQKQARQDADWLAWARKRGSQAFIVLTVCRLLYSLETGTVASKPVAARWVIEKSMPRRVSLIERTLTSQMEQQEISDYELADTLDFLDETLKQVSHISAY